MLLLKKVLEGEESITSILLKYTGAQNPGAILLHQRKCSQLVELENDGSGQIQHYQINQFPKLGIQNIIIEEYSDLTNSDFGFYVML